MIRKLIYLTLTIVAAFLPVGCSSDEPFSPNGGDGSTSINLLIPSPALAKENTRAQNDYSDEHGTRLANEGTVKKLCVAGFYELPNSTGTKHFYTELNPNHATTVDDIYLNYSMSVVPGTYRLYIFANLDIESGVKTLLQNESTTPADLESKVQGLRHDFKTSLPTAEGGLPMANATPISVTVEKGDRKSIEAELGFLCSKVRVSVIYDKAFGDTEKFKINGMDALNVWNKPLIYPGSGVNATGNEKKDKMTGVGNSAHYAIGAFESVDLSTIAASPIGTDPLDNLGTALNDPAGYTQTVWQSTVYLPECAGKDDDNKTKLQIRPEGMQPYTFVPGCNGSSMDPSGTGFKLERGHFYDIIAKVAESGEVEFEWNVNDWTPFRLTVQLAGLTELSLAQTRISETLRGDNPITISYHSNAPRLEFDIEKNAAGIPYFIVTENKAAKTITVRVNPDLGVSSELIEGKGFDVMAGNIKKKVIIDEIDLRPYLNIMPESQTINLKQIANEEKFSFYMDYSTNCEGLKLSISALTNNNSEQGFTPATGDVTKGAYMEICTNDSTVISKKIKLAVTTDLSKYLNDGETLPNNGLIKVTIVEPTDAAYFMSQISGTVKGTVTTSGVDPDEGKFILEPNPTKYVIHFKVIKGDGTINNDWSYPHIYVYQPLTYNGLPVYGRENENKNDDGSYSAVALNWLEYSFTGNRAFKGWKEFGGQINWFNVSASSFKDKAGNDIYGYDILTKMGNPSKAEEFATNPNYMEVNLLGDFKGTCSSCFPNTGGVHPYTLWPGIGMLKETGANAGWWKIELPLLAKPGSAMVMFKGHHDTNDSQRYPLSGIPGIPLPIYADCEAWYLLDEGRGGDNCAFSDERRDRYDSSSDPIEDEELDTDKIGLVWYTIQKDTYSDELCLYRSDWSEMWPDDKAVGAEWTRQTADIVVVSGTEQYYLIVIDRATFNQLYGYSWKRGVEAKWSDGKHTKISTIPSAFNSYDLKELHRIYN